MAKICPETNEPVLYLNCIECETKVCKKGEKTKKEENKKRGKENEEKDIC